tara:strand:- start:1108 stop:1845 length:738 start_codon:yes stop_codon:yes gene_type:complete
MVSLIWTNLNPTVEYCHTTKKYFNKFLYKAVVYLPGGNLIRNTKFDDMQMLIEQRLSWHGRTYNYGGSWVSLAGHYPLRKHIEEAKVEQLEYWRDVVKAGKPGFTFRVEEPSITIYTNDQDELYKLIESDPRPAGLRQLFRPESTEAFNALDRGEIILRKEIDYNYRVCFKEGKFDSNIVDSINRLLQNQGNDVKLTNSCKKNLEGRRFWFTSSYFYTKDLDVVTMIKLISPDIISGIFKVTRIP